MTRCLQWSLYKLQVISIFHKGLNGLKYSVFFGVFGGKNPLLSVKAKYVRNTRPFSARKCFLAGLCFVATSQNFIVEPCQFLFGEKNCPNLLK
jgi:hypothetical protein